MRAPLSRGSPGTKATPLAPSYRNVAAESLVSAKTDGSAAQRDRQLEFIAPAPIHDAHLALAGARLAIYSDRNGTVCGRDGSSGDVNVQCCAGGAGQLGDVNRS